MKKLIACTLAITGLFASTSALAVCEYQANKYPNEPWARPFSMQVPISGTYSVPSDAPVGYVIRSFSMPIRPSDATYLKCIDDYITVHARMNGSSASPGGSYYPTMSWGIGLQVSMGSIGNPTVAFPSQREFPTNGFGQDGYVFRLGPSTVLNYSLIKTKPGPVYGYLDSGLLPTGSLVVSSSSPDYKIFDFNFTGSTTLLPKSCSTGNVRVDMGEHKSREFNGVGTRTTPVVFNILLTNCPADLTAATYQIDTPSRTIPGVANVIGLEGGAGSAEGVGIQLLDSANQPIAFNKAYPIPGIGIASTSYSIPVKAAYYQWRPEIGAGRANGTVTFTLNYK